LALCSRLSAADYRFVKIDVPGATFTIANGINARGDIIGPYHDANGIGHGFLLHKGVFTTLNFPCASFTGARAINARGDIVGRIQFADGIDHAYLLHDGKFTQIDFPGAFGTNPRGFNNAGDRGRNDRPSRWAHWLVGDRKVFTNQGRITSRKMRGSGQTPTCRPR